MTDGEYQSLSMLSRAKIIKALPHEAGCPFPLCGGTRCDFCPCHYKDCPANNENPELSYLDALIAEHNRIEGEKKALDKISDDYHASRMKYKVGDKVLVRSDLVSGRVYGVNIACDPMVPLAGAVVTIKGESKSIKGQYKIVEDALDCNWTDEMFVGLAPEVVDLQYEEENVCHADYPFCVRSSGADRRNG